MHFINGNILLGNAEPCFRGGALLRGRGFGNGPAPSPAELRGLQQEGCPRAAGKMHPGHLFWVRARCEPFFCQLSFEMKIPLGELGDAAVLGSQLFLPVPPEDVLTHPASPRTQFAVGTGFPSWARAPWLVLATSWGLISLQGG